MVMISSYIFCDSNHEVTRMQQEENNNIKKQKLI